MVAAANALFRAAIGAAGPRPRSSPGGTSVARASVGSGYPCTNDARSLGENECSGFELGLSRTELKALQQVAFDELAAAKAVTASPLALPKPVTPERCARAR